MDKIRLLMVDDSADDRELFARLLQRTPSWDLDFRQAADGREAHQALRSGHDLEVILLDLALPGESGLMLLQEWSDNYPALPAVIVLTGTGERAAVEAMKHGAFDYLSKHDCTPEELVHAVWHGALTTRLRRELGGTYGIGWPPGSGLAHDQFMSGEASGVRRAVATFLHEVNSPLTGIVNYVLMLLDEAPTEHMQEVLMEMLDACRRIERVMHSLEGLEELRGRPGGSRRGLLDLS